MEEKIDYIMLTGATGFLGSHLLKKLFQTTNYHFIVLKRVSSAMDKVRELSKNARVIFFDLEKDFQNLNEIPKGNIKAIIHCATNYGRNQTSCVDVLKTNLIFPIKLLEFAIERNIELFINTDSYFNKNNLSYMHLQNYSLSKKSLNLWLRYFSDKIKIVNVILEHIYGENDSKEKFTSFVVDEVAIKKSGEINLTHGDQKRDFIYIDDVVEAYRYILSYALSNKVKMKNFNLGTGRLTTIKDFVKTVKEVSNAPTCLNFGAIAYREDEIMYSKADNEELLNLGWKPKFTIKEGIRKYIENEEKIINCNSDL